MVQGTLNLRDSDQLNGKEFSQSKTGPANNFWMLFATLSAYVVVALEVDQVTTKLISSNPNPQNKIFEKDLMRKRGCLGSFPQRPVKLIL